MQDYRASDITAQVRALSQPEAAATGSTEAHATPTTPGVETLATPASANAEVLATPASGNTEAPATPTAPSTETLATPNAPSTETLEAPAPAHWQKSRIALAKETAQPFLVFQSVETENERKIILDDYSADITLLTAIKSSQQMNTLAYVCERLLTDKALSEGEVFQKTDAILHQLFTEQMQTRSLLPDALSRFYEEIRAIDAVCCLNRMRNVTFKV